MYFAILAKEKNDMIISNNIKKTDKTQHLKKKTQKMGIKDNFLNFVKNTYKKYGYYHI